MAEADFPPSINRRRLMAAAATVAATGSILPVVKRADAAAAPHLFKSPPLTLEVEPGDFCAATARRLLEIARRNEIRREAKLRAQRPSQRQNGIQNPAKGLRVTLLSRLVDARSRPHGEPSTVCFGQQILLHQTFDWRRTSALSVPVKDAHGWSVLTLAAWRRARGTPRSSRYGTLRRR
jgi:hypothetical protein